MQVKRCNPEIPSRYDTLHRMKGKTLRDLHVAAPNRRVNTPHYTQKLVLLECHQ